MTNEEAKKICDDYITNILNINQMRPTKEDMKQAMNISKEQAEAFGIVIKAFDKEIPMKVQIEKWKDTECPNGCGHVFSETYGDGYFSIQTMPNRCPCCGQVLDWGNTKEDE